MVNYAPYGATVVKELKGIGENRYSFVQADGDNSSVQGYHIFVTQSTF